MIFTYQDALDHMLAYAGDDATATATTKHRRAIQMAYRMLPSRHNWDYLVGIGRVTTVAAYATGTISYDHTGGTNEREVTLTDGTWPSWAASGYLTIGNVTYEVDERVSDTVITLESGSNPGEDVAAGTAYSLQQDQYELPEDFVSGDETVANDVGTVLNYAHPRDWSSQRRISVGPGEPRIFSYVGDPGRIGSLKIVLWPAPDAVYQLDFLYRRKPRALVYEAESDGTVSVTASSTTVTGTGTNFKSGMVGSIIRLAADNQTVPTGDGGANPAVVERTITAVSSTTSLTVSSAISDAYTGVKYAITDPVDVDGIAMVEFFMRECEKQWRILARSIVQKLDEERDYRMAMVQALEANSHSTARRAAGRSQSRRSGFDRMPLDWGV